MIHMTVLLFFRTILNRQSDISRVEWDSAVEVYQRDFVVTVAKLHSKRSIIIIVL